MSSQQSWEDNSTFYEYYYTSSYKPLNNSDKTESDLPPQRLLFYCGVSVSALLACVTLFLFVLYIKWRKTHVAYNLWGQKYDPSKSDTADKNYPSPTQRKINRAIYYIKCRFALMLRLQPPKNISYYNYIEASKVRGTLTEYLESFQGILTFEEMDDFLSNINKIPVPIPSPPKYEFPPPYSPHSSAETDETNSQNNQPAHITISLANIDQMNSDTPPTYAYSQMISQSNAVNDEPDVNQTEVV